MRTLLTVALAICLSGMLPVFQTNSRPAFEAAVVKLNISGEIRVSMETPGGGRFSKTLINQRAVQRLGRITPKESTILRMTPSNPRDFRLPAVALWFVISESGAFLYTFVDYVVTY